jgi:hypothetical protein
MEVALNKSSYLLKIILQNSQTLQLLITNIKIENIYKCFKKCQAKRLGLRALGFY